MPVPPRPVALAVATAAVAAVGAVRVATYTPAAAPGPPSPSPSVSVSPSPSPARTPAPRPSPTATAAARPRTLFPIPAPPAVPAPCPPPPRPRRPYTPWTPPRTVPESQLPAPLPPVPLTAPLDAVRGKGMWVYQWPRTEGGDVAAVVRRAKATGLTQIWVRSGSSRQGFYAGPLLDRLLPAAHRAGLEVLVWDFPYLHDPIADAERAAATLAHTAPGGHRIDGFSPDIETAGEGVVASTRRVEVYLSRVRRAAGSRPVVATVPRPTTKRLASFPYAAMARYVDAFAAMVYWSCHEPGRLATDAVNGLARFGRPVHLIGQAYDMASEGGRPGDPTPREIWRFLDVGRRRGAIGVSFYVWQTATGGQFDALRSYPWN